MPCCCATNVEAAFVLGIVLAVLNGLSCFNEDPEVIANGIIGAVIHCTLIFGAHKRNSTAILVWMVLAILECIVFAIFAILAVVAIAGAGVVVGVHAGEGAAGGVAGIAVFGVVFIVFMIGIILFQIWTIMVAKNARKEIDADLSDYQFEILQEAAYPVVHPQK